ncbi:MAG: TIGR01906 family membrane protein [Aggregatilineales bacterium]
MTIQISSLIETLLRLVLTVAIFFLLIAISARLVMTRAFLTLEYNRPDFPSDPYGFTAEDRLYYAPYTLDYLLYHEDIAYLEELAFPDGFALFNERELQHMEDVQQLTIVVFTAAVWAAVLVVFMSLALARAGRRPTLLRAYRDAGLLAFGVIVFTIAFAITSWNAFFTGFHSAFFAEGTWYFAYSDTLIRLFPEQFWFDATIAVGILTGLGALGLIFVTWQVGRSA